MDLTPYLITAPHPDDHTSIILFAAKTGALVEVDAATYTALQRSEVAAEYLAPLTEMGFLVDSHEDERQAVYSYLDEINRVNPNLTLALVLGLECNFACRYCFEGSQKGRHAMDERSAEQLVTFIKERFGPEKKILQLQVYGGEPLLYTRRLINLARQLKPFAEERNAALSIDLISNGSLLTEKVVDELTPWGLDGVKVTLDGPATNHNKFRPFRSGTPSFDVIVDNLSRVKGKTKIRLGGNYTQDNYRCFPSLLDDLSDKGITPEHLEKVDFNIVMQVNDTLTANTYRGGCGSINEPWLVEASLFIREEILKRGYRPGEIGPAPCAVEIEDAYTVNYDGSLYKCVTWIGHEPYKIGDLWSGPYDDLLANHHLAHWKLNSSCQQCRYLPLCFGGCRFMEYQRSGSMAKVDCQKGYFDAALPAMLQQELRFRLAER